MEGILSRYRLFHSSDVDHLTLGRVNEIPYPSLTPTVRAFEDHFGGFLIDQGMLMRDIWLYRPRIIALWTYSFVGGH